MFDAIPFETPAPQIPFVIVEATVNGREKARVLLDTGAAAPFDVIVSPELAARTGAKAGRGPVIPSSGSVGSVAVSFRETRLKSFTLGPVKLQSAKAGVSNALDAVSRQLGRPIDAIVGQQFVKGRTISIDYLRKLVDFASTPRLAANAIPFRTAPVRPLTIVEAKINGRGPFQLALDTAASASVLSPAAGEKAGITDGSAVAIGGAGGSSTIAAKMTQVDVAVGSAHKQRQAVVVADIVSPVEAASGASLDGILGADFLTGSKLTIDYSAGRLWIEWQSTK